MLIKLRLPYTVPQMSKRVQANTSKEVIVALVSHRCEPTRQVDRPGTSAKIYQTFAVICHLQSAAIASKTNTGTAVPSVLRRERTGLYNRTPC